MELRDDDLLLRPPTLDDVPSVTRACQDPELARFIPGFPTPYTDEDARSWITSSLSAEREKTFLIVDTADGQLCGAIGLRLGETGSIGYWVAAEARGRGLATRATKLLSRWALTEGGVERLELIARVENVASQRVAEKAGFTREGVLRAHVKFPDGRRHSVMFSLLPSDLS